jgi:hypothetical protein
MPIVAAAIKRYDNAVAAMLGQNRRVVSALF